jgi:hypothetical protein
MERGRLSAAERFRRLADQHEVDALKHDVAAESLVRRGELELGRLESHNAELERLAADLDRHRAQLIEQRRAAP